MAQITFADKDNNQPSGTARKQVRDVDLNEIKNVVNTNDSNQASVIAAAIQALIDGAPGSLNTLNELAEAIGNDADFSVTVTNALTGKQATLVSGTNIKTVNGVSIVGSGNIPLVDDTIDNGVTSRTPSQEAVFEALALKATIAYVDDVAGSLVSSWKTAADVASTANLTLSGEQTIDGVLTSTSRVLVKNQTAPAENGIYVTAAGAWSRTTDTNTAIELEGAAVTVQQGTTQGNTSWIQTTDNITLGTSAIVWNQLGTSVQDADATTKGVARLYPSTSLGSNTDGAATQNAVKVYADAKVADAINNGTTTVAPSQNAVFDALALKANIASPTFTGTVAGITKSMVGLDQVDNTADSAKPISTATQTALNLKATVTSFAKGISVLGTINGSNLVFTIGQSIVSGSEDIFINGLRMTDGIDYGMTFPGGVPTITFIVAPVSGDIIRTNYIRP